MFVLLASSQQLDGVLPVLFTLIFNLLLLLLLLLGFAVFVGFAAAVFSFLPMGVYVISSLKQVQAL